MVRSVEDETAGGGAIGPHDPRPNNHEVENEMACPPAQEGDPPPPATEPDDRPPGPDRSRDHGR